MQKNYANINEENVETAFSKQAIIFDDLYANDSIIQYKRKRVRELIKRTIPAKCNILELNCGTGEDAIWLANEGHLVHATDISANMLEVLHQKVKSSKLENRISYELCSFSALDKLCYRGPYDLIFSNFAGLNCTGELEKVLQYFSPLLKPEGIVTLVILPPFCLWESLLIFKGMFKTATRRLLNKNGTPAKVEGSPFKCWYYKPSVITNHLKEEFTLLNIEGLCTIVPPSYISQFGQKHPGIFKFLSKKENKWKDKWPWKYIGDYYIITLKKNSR